MVSEAYDHLIAIVIVSMIFIGTVVALPAINYSNLQAMDQQQLRNAALNVFDSMLLDVGSPPNWGSDPSSIGKFGLAYADPFSKYVLDIDKVQRINETNPTGSIPYEDIRALLHIEEDYGFQFTLSRPFEVDAALTIDNTNSKIYFDANVTRTEDGTPIPNAKVSVTTTASVLEGNNFDVVTLPTLERSTDSSGRCTGYQELPGGDTITQAASIMEVSVAGMLTTVIAKSVDEFGGIVTVYSSGDTLTMAIPADQIPARSLSEVKLHKIAGYKDGGLVTFFEWDGGTPVHFNYGAGTFATLEQYCPGLKVLGPTALLIWVELSLKEAIGNFPHPGNWIILLTGSLDFASTDKVFSAGRDATSENPIVVMRRLVVISDMTYVANLTFWRERV